MENLQPNLPAKIWLQSICRGKFPRRLTEIQGLGEISPQHPRRLYTCSHVAPTMEDERRLHLLRQTQVPATRALVPPPAAEAARAAARRPTTRPRVQPRYIPATGVKERDLAPGSKQLLDKQLRNVDSCDRAVLAAGKGNQAYAARGLRALGMEDPPTNKQHLFRSGSSMISARLAASRNSEIVVPYVQTPVGPACAPSNVQECTVGAVWVGGGPGGSNVWCPDPELLLGKKNTSNVGERTTADRRM
jgi:hypothetical protein|eukprot:COSAG01_NODE_3756_length_5726_cov_2.015994_9_plen_247_part_00